MLSDEKRGRLRDLIAAAALGAFLIVPATSHGAVTIGSNLNRAPDNQNFNCSAFLPPGCDNVINTLPSFAQATGGITSPVNGIVTSWRVRSGPDTSPGTQLRIARLLNNLFTGAGTSSAQTPPPNTTSPSYPTQLPISIGDRIGLRCCATQGDDHFVPLAGASLQNFVGNQQLIDGSSQGFPGANINNFELAVEAVIEPTSAFTVKSVQKLKKSRLRVTVDLPNPGTLVAGDPRSKQTGASAAAPLRKKKKKKKKPLLNQTTASPAIPGDFTLVVNSTKAARALLQAKAVRTGRKAPQIAARLQISFTPTGGSAAVETTKTKLRR